MNQEQQRAKEQALRLLEIRARSVHELRERLQKKGHGWPAIDSVIDDLKDLGLLDDEKFAQAWTDSRKNGRAVGARRIQSELRAKGVDPGIIKKVMNERATEVDELETALHLAQRRMHSMKGLPRQVVQRRVGGYLARRGFATGTIIAVMKQVEIPVDEE